MEDIRFFFGRLDLREKAVEEKQEEPVMAEQLSLFDFMWENAVLPIDKGDGLF